MKRSVSVLSGVGPARQKILAEAGIESIGDLLYYFPRRYVDRTLTDSTVLQAGHEVTLIVVVQNQYVTHGRRGSRLVVQVRTLTGEGLTLVWFRGVPYFRKLIESDQTLIVSGRLDFFQGLQMVHPDFELIDADDQQALVHVGRIIPLYPTTESLRKQHLDSRGFRRLISQALELADLEVEEVIPDTILNSRALAGRREALSQIHYPESHDRLQAAQHRMKYEELFLFGVLMVQKKRSRAEIPRQVHPVSPGISKEFERLRETLPFRLTADQENAIGQILNAVGGSESGAFLLQGDVGSGKTVVALAIALHYIDAGLQVALMAPTEVLARQHFQTLVNLIGLSENTRIEMVAGQGAKTKGRQAAIERIRTGDANLVVGTHALIEDAIEFSRLGLVVIDEQHRFGVEQREKIRSKGLNPDTIAMTATPIPRSLCLTEYADLDLVLLRERPAGRKPVQTLLLNEARRSGLHKSIRKHVSMGRQCFIVYPVIDESAKLDLRAASDAYEELSKTVFPDFRVGLLHGRLKAAEKERTMSDFRSGRLQILVTTTVIEVGIDVPNATIMVVEHAERFGISQLHQLRGRVGRGSEESFCVLVSDAEGEEALQRLTAIRDTDDGFTLAEIDMQMRGPGELLGLRQHGFPGFLLADLLGDRDLAEVAHSDANRYPDIGEEARRLIRRRFQQGVSVFPN